ncbi:Rne/Rng family ribonuclease [Aureibacter tunicatorum]|uniref:Ribonuclease G n=1 Tax=Aureibacter tunicatorum TaxID=866807 RepID=A0AAE4BQU4_9BACT|nr:Rne/Rng family ribonuclease [Aureibacter tunicatorum]MDR6237100.1 ribonuclease G [Aureibacter tunicatorum]BDD06092.1 ribonuclease G [Aureibacter tunicatorum]
MSSELFIAGDKNDSRMALLQDKKLVEFNQEAGGNKFNVGDIYLGTVRKIVPGLNAAFIDIGYEKDAFLHYLDLGPQVSSLNKYLKMTQNRKNSSYKLANFKMEPDIDKHGKINQVLSKNQQILVQVVKEPISTKGPRLSCELSIAGRYIVLVPFSNSVNISKRVTSKEERKRLVRLITSIKPEGFGVIIRTVAEGKDVAELDRDLRDLVSKWKNGVKALSGAKSRDLVIGELNRASSMLRDLLSESFDAIYADDKDIYEDIKSYISTIEPEKEKIVKHYTGKVKLFENFGIEKQVKSLFGQSVSLPNGGYLIVEHTEACHVIDVNSGNKSNAESDQETTAVKVNLESAKEIARQLRLRDMGGIIIIDFIDMKSPENKRLIFEKMKEEMKGDRSKFTILPLTKFGLMQITRQRVRPEMNITTREKCPTCGGTGKVTATILVTDHIERDLEYILTKQNESGLTISLHPFLFAFYTKGIISRRVRWYFKYWKWVKLELDTSLAITDYVFKNSQGDVIEI